MRNFVRAFIGLAALGATVAASAQTRSVGTLRSNADIDIAPYSKPQHATPRGVVNLSTGEYTKFDRNDTNTRAITAVFDSYNSSAPDAPNGENMSWTPAGGQLGCSFDPILYPSGFFFYLINRSQDGCVSRPAWGTANGWSNNLDIYFDNYLVDPANWANNDPNTIDTIEQMTVQVGISSGANPSPNFGMGVVVGFYEWNDRNGDGNFYRVGSGPWLYVFNVSEGFRWILTMGANGLGLDVYGFDIMLIDVFDGQFDPNTGLPTGDPLCGLYYPIAGGVDAIGNTAFGHLVGDPNGPGCRFHDETMLLGKSTVPGFATDFSYWMNGFADPNGTLLDPNENGVPGLQYEEIWNSGTGAWVGSVLGDSANWTWLPQTTTFILSVDAGGPPPCGGADINGDNVVDLTDLAVLLSDFDCTSGCVGDVDGDDDTDLTDLAILLANFDCTY